MRDLSRATGMSLAGLYYYFKSKERLLFLIQKHTFSTILEKLKTRLEDVNRPRRAHSDFHPEPSRIFRQQPAGIESSLARR